MADSRNAALEALAQSAGGEHISTCLPKARTRPSAVVSSHQHPDLLRESPKHDPRTLSPCGCLHVPLIDGVPPCSNTPFSSPWKCPGAPPPVTLSSTASAWPCIEKRPQWLGPTAPARPRFCAS